MATVPPHSHEAQDEKARSEATSEGHPEGPTRPEVVLALARAVAAPQERAHRYDGAENRLAGWSSMEDAVAEGVAFVVRLGQHVIGIDLDTPIEVEMLPDILALLRGHRLRPVLVASGQSERRHVFVRVQPTQRRAVEAEVVSILGSREALRHDIRPPLSPHRLGLPVRLVDPVDPAVALAALEPVQAPPGRLSSRTMTLLREGDHSGAYASRSEVTMAVVTGMVNKQWPYPLVLAALLDWSNAAGAKVQEIHAERGRAEAERYVQGRYDKAVDWVRANPQFSTPQEFVVALVEYRLRVRDWSWPGTAGQKQKVVLTALLDMMVENGRVEVEPSHRRLAEETGLARNTVAGVLASLVEGGWLISSSRGKGYSNGYRVNLKDRRLNSGPLGTSPGGGCEGSGTKLSPNHDAFRHGGGLGKNGYEVLRLLHEPLSATDLAARTSIPKSTLKRLLASLTKAGLVTKTDEVYQARSGLALTLQLGVYARDRGTHLRVLRQREVHQRQREERSTDPEAAEKWPQSLSVAPEPRVVQGLLDPRSGDFQPRMGPLSASDSDLGEGRVGPFVLTIPYGGYVISIQNEHEVINAATHDAKSRRFGVFASTTEMLAASADEFEESVEVSERGRLDLPECGADRRVQ